MSQLAPTNGEPVRGSPSQKVSRSMSRITSFIHANTELLAPPLVPEIKLYLAEESLPIWRRTEEELGEMNVPPPFWAFPWAGGQALARYILDHPETVRGRSVLDLGSGSGLVAIAAALAGARQVTANDIDAFAIAACAVNAAANNVTIATSCANLIAVPVPVPAPRAPDPHMPGQQISSPDVLCLGDIFYDKPLAASVMAYARRDRERVARVLAGDPRRSYFPQERFRKIAEYAVPVTRELEDSEIKKSAVWRLA